MELERSGGERIDTEQMAFQIDKSHSPIVSKLSRSAKAFEKRREGSQERFGESFFDGASLSQSIDLSVKTTESTHSSAYMMANHRKRNTMAYRAKELNTIKIINA